MRMWEEKEEQEKKMSSGEKRRIKARSKSEHVNMHFICLKLGSEIFLN